MSIFQKFDNALALVERTLLVIAVLLMIVLAFTQVILRNFFQTGLTWADVLLRNMVLWVGFIGAQLATKASRHINVDALSRFLPPRIHGIAQWLIHIVSAFVCILLGWAAINFITVEMEGGTELYGLGIPTWWAEVIIPVGFFIMAGRFLLKLIADVGEILNR